MGSNNEYGGLRRVSDRLRESAKSLTDVVPLLRGSVVRRCAVSLASAAVLLSGCGKEPSEAYGSVGGNADGAIEVGFRPGTLTIAGSASDGAGWNTRSARRGAAASYPGMATRADLPPTGMVEGAFQIGDLWVDGNRGTATEKGMTWAEAMTYCQELGLRLPTEDEALNEIIPYVRANDPLPDSRKFVWRDGSYDEYYYWTSTPRSADANYVWSYYMHSAHTGVLGSMEGRDASYDAAPRCVKRDGELPPAPDSGPEVENPDGLPAGTTFRVLVYNAGDDPQEASPVAQNTYKVADAQGTIVATAVDERGNATEGEVREIVLRRGAYDFYYFSPAVAANTALPNPGMYTDLTNGADYMALAHREVIDPSQGPKHYIPEVCFYRMGSYIDVRISPRAGEILGTLEVSGEGLQLWGLPKSGFYEVGQYPYRLSVEGQGGMVEFAPEAFASEAGSTATVSTVGVRGGRAVLPGYANELTARVTLTSDGKEMKLSSTLSGYVFEPGYRYVVELGVGRIADKPELDITILPWNEYAWGDGEIGGEPPAEEKLPPLIIDEIDMELEPEPDGSDLLTWTEAIEYCSNKGEGWRLPTVAEMFYFYIIKPEIDNYSPFGSNSYYWTSTKSGESTVVTIKNTAAGNLDTYTGEKLLARCVKGGISVKKYPYVTTDYGGTVIVLKDKDGGLDDAVLYSEKLTTSDQCLRNDAHHKISRKFRLQNVGATATERRMDDQGAFEYCHNLAEDGLTDWRLPTGREMLLIWIAGGATGDIDLNKNDTGVGDERYPFLSNLLPNAGWQLPTVASDKRMYYWVSNAFDERYWSTVMINTGDEWGFSSMMQNKNRGVLCICDVD